MKRAEGFRRIVAAGLAELQQLDESINKETDIVAAYRLGQLRSLVLCIVKEAEKQIVILSTGKEKTNGP